MKFEQQFPGHLEAWRQYRRLNVQIPPERNARLLRLHRS